MFQTLSAVSGCILGKQSVMDEEERLRSELMTMTVSYGSYAVSALYTRRACAARVAVYTWLSVRLFIPRFLSPRARNRKKSDTLA